MFRAEFPNDLFMPKISVSPPKIPDDPFFRKRALLFYHYSQWRKPGAEFGGTEKIFADQDDVYSEKICIFEATISDDLLFLVIDQVFLFSLIFRIFTLLN